MDRWHWGDGDCVAIVSVIKLATLFMSIDSTAKVSIAVRDYYWKVPVGQERCFTESRGDWTISVVLARKPERRHWTKPMPGFGRSPVIATYTSIKKVFLRYRGATYEIRTGLKGLYNPNWIRIDKIKDGLVLTLETTGYSDGPNFYLVDTTYQKTSVKRRVRDMVEEVEVEAKSCKPLNWPSVL